jgi:hypothetical protein
MSQKKKDVKGQQREDQRQEHGRGEMPGLLISSPTWCIALQRDQHAVGAVG